MQTHYNKDVFSLSFESEGFWNSQMAQLGFPDTRTLTTGRQQATCFLCQFTYVSYRILLLSKFEVLPTCNVSV